MKELNFLDTFQRGDGSQGPEATVGFREQVFIRFRLHLFLCSFLSQKAGQTDFHTLTGFYVPPPSASRGEETWPGF